MRRTYPFRCSRSSKLIAALVAAVALAGCGSSTPTATTPAASVSTVGSGTFDPSLVSTTKGTTASTPAKAPSTKKTSKKGASTTTTASNASQALALSSGATPTTSTPATTSTPTIATAPPVTKVRTITKTIVKPKIKIVTVTKYATKYLTKTVTVAPKVPIGAFLPSTHPALSMTSFKLASGSVGCSIGGGSVRCDVGHQTWTAPAQPASCKQSWGSGIVLLNSSAAHLPQFACGGGSALRASAKVVHNGYDDTVGGITCQVRGFGVNCFAADSKGFILSPTGYILY